MTDHQHHHHQQEPFTEDMILASVPKVSGLISILCTIYILNEIRIDRKSGRLPITPITRLVVGMSIFVLILGMAWFASNWMVPPLSSLSVSGDGSSTTTTIGDDHGFLAPSGNRWTCRIQGFLLTLALGPPLYNAAILWFAQLSIMHNWTNERIAQTVEVPTHCAIVIWCVCSACLLLLLDKYHSIGPVCWASNPPNCSSSNNNDDDVAGNNNNNYVSCNVKIYSTILYCVPLWTSLLYTIVSCIRINCHVHRNHSGQKQVVQRADSLVVLYSLAIFITYTPCIIWSFTFWNDYESFALTLLFGLLEPLQGIWNLAIFLMNRRQATRARLRKLLTDVVCRPCKRKQRQSPNTGGTDNDDDDDDDTTFSEARQHHHNPCHIPQDHHHHQDRPVQLSQPQALSVESSV